MTAIDYEFILNQWKLCNLNETQVQNAVTKGYITQTQADEVKATPRNCD